MKTKFLDLQNCYRLLPTGSGLPLFARLEECLSGINKLSSNLNGSIDALIRRNENTINRSTGVKRLCNSPIEISQDSEIKKRTVHTQALERRFPGPALLHTVLGYENGMMHKIIIPLQFLLKGWGDAEENFQCYTHIISHNVDVEHIRSYEDLFRRNMTDSDSYYYVGITGRNWLQRLEEHIREMRKGNRRLFYQIWRDHYGMKGVFFISVLRNINLTYEEAMNWEEETVDKMGDDKYGLNMIPGGFKGLRELYKSRIIDSLDISLEERELAVSEYIRCNPRKGFPNPFIADLWKDDDYYQKIMEARLKTLSKEQVMKIRELSMNGWSNSAIVDEVGAINELQVERVLAGKTYIRYR